MRKFLKVFVGCLVATSPLIAVAAPTAEPSDIKWEVSGGATFGVQVTSEKNQDDQKFWTLTTKAGYYVAPQLQVGADLSYYNASQGTLSGHYFAFFVGPTFDFLPDPLRTPYVFGGIGEGMSGFTSDSVSTSYSINQFAYTFGAGIRVRLADHVTWSPEIQYISLDSAADGSVSVSASQE